SVNPHSRSFPTRRSSDLVLAVEAATGVGRGALRRDLYGEHPGMVGDLDDVDAARAQEYALLSVLLARAPDRAQNGEQRIFLCARSEEHTSELQSRSDLVC